MCSALVPCDVGGNVSSFEVQDNWVVVFPVALFLSFNVVDGSVELEEEEGGLGIEA